MPLFTPGCVPTTSRPATGCCCLGAGSVSGPLEGFTQGPAPRICTGCALTLVNDRVCGTLDSAGLNWFSALKSSSRVEGWMALNPIPVTGTTKVGLLSALIGLVTAN